MSWITPLLKRIWPDPPITAHVLIPQISAGPDAWLGHLELGDPVTEIPSIGINLEHVSDHRSGTKFVSWGLVCSQPIAFPLVFHALLFSKAQAVMPIINVDCDHWLGTAREVLNDSIWTEEIKARRWVRQREAEWAKKEASGGRTIYTFIKEADYDILSDVMILEKLPILLLVNYQDMSTAAEADELGRQLNLEEYLAGRTWRVQPCSMETGEGLREGFEWLATRTPSAQQEMFRRMANNFPKTKIPEMREH